MITTDGPPIAHGDYTLRDDSFPTTESCVDRPRKQTKMLNPRLTDAFGLAIKQEDVRFLIPHLEEDLPLCIDPFLLWKSPDDEDRKLHEMLLAFFDRLRQLVLTDKRDLALSVLLRCHESREIGLGYAQGSKRGQAIGPKLANDLLNLFPSIPQLSERSFLHMEEIQLLVPGISEDRISDVAASILKEPLIAFSESTARQLSIPTKAAVIADVFDGARMEWSPGRRANLPYNPVDGSPILLVPIAWLRKLPWINYSDYYRSHYSHLVLPPDYRGRVIRKEDVMAFNRANYRETAIYVRQKETSASQCIPEYFFNPATVETQKKWFESLREIEAGVQQAHESLSPAPHLPVADPNDLGRLPPRDLLRHGPQNDLLYFHRPLHRGLRVREHVFHGLLPSPPAKRTDHLLSQPDISCANDTKSYSY